jgi:glycosidase
MKHIKVLFLAVLSIIFLSCQSANEQADRQIEIAKGINSPVYLNGDTTTVFLLDYILFPKKIDSIQQDAHYDFVWNKKAQKLLIKAKSNFNFIENLRIFSQGNYVDIPLYKDVKKTIRFTFPKDHKIKKVQFKSQIVGWQTVDMQQDSLNWYFEKALAPGNYQYLFVADDKEILDPKATRISNGMGGFNSLLQIPLQLDKKPFLSMNKQAETHFELTFEQSVSKIYAYLDKQLISDKNIVTSDNNVQISIPKNTKNSAFVTVYAYNDYGRSNDILIPLDQGKIVTKAKQLNRQDFHTQIMYFLMVDRFNDGNRENNRPIHSDSILDKVNFKGGDIQGVVQKVSDGYFKDLGINTIWLSPILKNPESAYGKWLNPATKFSGYHGYWPVSNIKIDDRFGDAKSLKKLLSEAHQQDCNVILDYVANHVHKDHILYKQHPDWFTDLYLPDGTMNTEKWDSHRLTTWFDTFLPTIDFSKHEVVEKMTDSAMYWLQQFDIDGFRHDATKHIQLDYWRTLTQKIKRQIKRPVYQIGETYGSPELIRSYVNSGMLDGQFNFNLYDASVAVFAKNDEPSKRLADALQESLTYYGQHNLMGNISGNQDRVRFISYASGDVPFEGNGKQIGWTKNIQISDTLAYYKLEMLQAFNLSIPGVPCIYYGDEYGMPGANDPDNRRLMRFSGLNRHEKHLKAQVKKLIHLRKNSMALIYGTTQILEENNVLIIKRKYFEDEIIIIFNKSDKVYTYKSLSIAPNTYQIISPENIQK